MAAKITDKMLQQALKDRWLAVNPNVAVEWDAAYPYYFKELNANLLYEMSNRVYHYYNEGSGSELKKRTRKGKKIPPKMLALKSSSAMTFNIFGNGDANGNIIILGNEYGLPIGKYKLEYEKQLPALNSRAPANLDACLSSEAATLFFEMKMTEWFGTPSALSPSYLKEDAHFPDEKFRQLMQSLMKSYLTLTKEQDNQGGYKCKTKHFDAFQIMKHIFGIYNGIHEGKLPKVPVIKIIVGFWTAPDADFFKGDKNLYSAYQDAEEEMRQEFRIFYDGLEDINDLFGAQGICFELKLLTVREIVECLEKSAVEMDALRRYL